VVEWKGDENEEMKKTIQSDLWLASTPTRLRHKPYFVKERKGLYPAWIMLVVSSPEASS
jgi:hypothetical protein